MPISNVNETEQSTLSSVEVSNTVFFPIANYSGWKVWKDLSDKGFKECSSEDDLKEYEKLIVGDDYSEGKTYIDGTSRLIIMRLINLGLKVLVASVEADVTSHLITDTEVFDELCDKTRFDIRFITTGLTGNSLWEFALSAAQKRGDCVALLSFQENNSAFAYNAASMHETASTLNDTATGKLGSGYASIFTPWINVTQSSLNYPLGKTSVKTEYLIPGCFAYLFAYARMISSGTSEWFAVAGVTRGKINELVSVNHEFSASEIEVLQGRKGDDIDDTFEGVSINTISTVRPYGHVIWGNRTTNVNSETEELKSVAFLNVRNLITTIKKVIYNATKKYTFDQNSAVLWDKFKKEIIPTLDEMKSGQGIVAYKLEQEKTTKKARIKAKLTIIPIESVEDFDIDIILNSNSTEIISN